ncbi:MAG: Na+/H+ antiporter subunit E [Candidatus Binatia bacterium]
MSLRQVYYFLRYLWIVAREVVLSSINVAKLVLGPLHRLRSGFVAVPLDARSDLEIAVFANSITLTPGTITVHVEPRKHLLVMHAIDIGQSPDELRQSTKAVLEANILLWTRAAARKEGR